MLLRLVCAALVALGSSCSSESARAAPHSSHMPTGAVRFDSHAPGETVVQVTIGRRGPFRFLVDTGSSHSAVTEALVAKVGASPVATTTLTTAAGTVECLVVRLTSVAIGGAVAEELLPTVLPAASAAMFGHRLDGVLGQDFLGSRNYTIDYDRRHIVWGDAGAPANTARLRLRSVNDRPLLELPQRAGEMLVLVPDSGATHLVVFKPQGFQLRAAGDVARVETLAGSGHVTRVVVESLAVGRRTLRDVPGGLVNGVTLGPERGDGLLPLHFFDRVYFNNSEGYMSVE